MWVFKILGWVLLFASIAVLVDDSITAFQTGTFRMAAAGEVWFHLDPDSLNAVQSFIQRYVSVWVWDKVMVPILLAPALAVLGIPALIFLFIGRKRKRQHIF